MCAQSAVSETSTADMDGGVLLSESQRVEANRMRRVVAMACPRQRCRRMG